MSFQDGCNTIYDACADNGVTPDSNSPEDISNAIKQIAEDKYNEGYEKGESVGGTVGPQIRFTGEGNNSTGGYGVTVASHEFSTGKYFIYLYGVYIREGNGIVDYVALKLNETLIFRAGNIPLTDPYEKTKGTASGATVVDLEAGTYDLCLYLSNKQGVGICACEAYKVG